jgi:tetratricopeptide (TPR) repeat protein
LSLIALHRLDEARAVILQALEVNADRSILHMLLSKILLLEGKIDASLEEAQQEPDPFWRLCANAAPLYSRGRRDDADRALQALIDDYSDVAPFQIAEIHAWRNEADEAFRWLERARVERDNGLVELFVSPFLVSLHEDSRWPVFARDLGHRWPLR